MAPELTTTGFVAIPSGEALAADALRTVTARDETTVILLAGPIGCGKTTILISLYELFNEGPVGGLLFGGSATLAGFERICHPGRVTSGLSAPDTVRTSRSSGAAFLHIRVTDTSGGPPRTSSVLVSDVTGEAFVEARDVSEPTIITRPLWRRAGLICVVLDGEGMSLTTKRHAVRAGARSLLRSAHESNLIPHNCRLALITTKWDLVKPGDAEDFVTETESLLVKQYASSFESVSCHRIAARPTSNRVPYAYGVPRLLTEWVSRDRSKPAIAMPDTVKDSGLNDFSRAFWQL